MDIGTAMGAGWSSGISVYGVLAVLGLASRFDWVDAPSFVEQWWVIAAAVVLFCVEFVIDKIALLDTVWDGVHTFVRPAIGGLLMATATDTVWSTPALAASGVLLALSSHSAKASTRLVVNSSPEPASNVVVSLAEDGLAAAVMAIAIARPELAVAVVALLTVLSLAAAFVLYRVARRLGRNLRSATSRRRGQGDPPDPTPV
ncbi:MAG: DUF4126 domain-containing protein [Ilumatobacter fluminis]|uniref:DUF4126 domain-containing protein n=1 Tax=Ilumatobacter fluminis TaxID=467091 RepID=UPI0032EC950B